MTGVLFEKVEGGVLNPDLSKEMTKFLKMVGEAKAMFDVRQNEEITIRAKGEKGAVATMLASVFSTSGSNRGSGNTSTQRAASRLEEDEEIVDVEIEDEDFSVGEERSLIEGFEENE
jgi:hypothetical protein